MYPVSKKVSMAQLKIILRSEASSYIHLAIIFGLYTVKDRSVLFTLLIIIYSLFIFKKSKNLMLLALFLVVLFEMTSLIRYHQLVTPSEVNNTCEVVDTSPGSYIVRCDSYRLMVYSEENNYLSGDMIYIEGNTYEIEVMNIPHNFDYQNYKLSLHIDGLLDVNKSRFISHKFHLREISERLIRSVHQRFSELTASYLSMLLFGEDGYLSEELNADMRSISITHLFVISGMHVGILLYGIRYLLSFIYISKQNKDFISFVFLIGYVIITGFSVSVIRASLLVGLLTLSKAAKSYLTHVDILSIIFILFLLIEPLYLLQVGFQLSFLITLVILLSKDFLPNHQLNQMIIIQIVAMLFSFPILLGLNHSYNVIALLSGIIFYYIVAYLFLPVSFIVFLFSSLEYVYIALIQLFEGLLKVFSLTNISIDFQFSSLLSIFLYYIGVSFLIINLLSRKRVLKPLFILFFAFFISLGRLFPTPLSRVIFFDVNQGDSSLIQANGCNILIDSGSEDDYDSIIHYLEGENITTIDIVFITHFHEDHYGEMRGLLDSVDVIHLYASTLNQLFPEIEIIEKGDIVSCNHQLLNIVSANTGDSNQNNNSIVIETKIGNDNYLFTGDIEAEVEADIISNLVSKVNILKVAHHGSVTSSTMAFIEAINPDIAIISVGMNSYGHPSNEVIERFLKLGVKVLRTDSLGSIFIYYCPLSTDRVIHHYIHGISYLEKRLL